MGWRPAEIGVTPYPAESTAGAHGGNWPIVVTFRKIVAHARRKVVIDLTLDDDEGDRDDDDATEVSCLRNTRTTPQCMKLILFSRIDRLQKVDRFPSLPPVLSQSTHVADGRATPSKRREQREASACNTNRLKPSKVSSEDQEEHWIR